MKTTLIKRSVTLFLLLGSTVATLAGPQVGQPAPGFTATDISGQTVSLSDYKGKIVVMESYDSACPFCQYHYKDGAMQGLQKELTADGVVWLLINCVSRFEDQTPALAKKDWADQKMAITDWIIDDAGSPIARTYAMKTAPQAFVIDKDGTLAYQGAVDNLPEMRSDESAVPNASPPVTRNYIREAVQALLAGQKVPVPETKPYGCRLIYPGMPDAQMFQPPANMFRR